MSYETQALTYDNLLAGEVYVVETVPVAQGQTVTRGQLLECKVTTGTPATSFSVPSAAAAVGNIYRIAAQDIDTTSGAGKVVAYGAGYYNIDAVTMSGDASVNQMVLRASNIVLKNCQSSTPPSD